MSSAIFAATIGFGGTPIWAWLVPLVLVGGAAAFVIAYYRSQTFHDSIDEAFEAVLDAAPSKASPSMTIIRNVTPDEYNNIIARIGALFTTKRYVPQSQSPGFYVYQKQEAPRGCLMIFVHVIIALLLFALCLVPGIIYLVVIFSRGDKIRVASVQIAAVPEGYSFNIKAPGGIKKKIYKIIEPYLADVRAAPSAVAYSPAVPAAMAAPAVAIPPAATPAPAPQEVPAAAPPEPPQAVPSVDLPQAMPESVGLGFDEKECPFCAEVIKAKAIKCKHCGSDLK